MLVHETKRKDNIWNNERTIHCEKGKCHFQLGCLQAIFVYSASFRHFSTLLREMPSDKIVFIVSIICQFCGVHSPHRKICFKQVFLRRCNVKSLYSSLQNRLFFSHGAC